MISGLRIIIIGNVNEYINSAIFCMLQSIGKYGIVHWGQFECIEHVLKLLKRRGSCYVWLAWTLGTLVREHSKDWLFYHSVIVYIQVDQTNSSSLNSAFRIMYTTWKKLSVLWPYYIQNRESWRHFLLLLLVVIQDSFFHYYKQYISLSMY